MIKNVDLKAGEKLNLRSDSDQTLIIAKVMIRKRSRLTSAQIYLREELKSNLQQADDRSTAAERVFPLRRTKRAIPSERLTQGIADKNVRNVRLEEDNDLKWGA